MAGLQQRQGRQQSPEEQRFQFVKLVLKIRVKKKEKGVVGGTPTKAGAAANKGSNFPSLSVADSNTPPSSLQ